MTHQEAIKQIKKDINKLIKDDEGFSCIVECKTCRHNDNCFYPKLQEYWKKLGV